MATVLNLTLLLKERALHSQSDKLSIEQYEVVPMAIIVWLYAKSTQTIRNINLMGTTEYPPDNEIQLRHLTVHRLDHHSPSSLSSP